MVNASTTRLLGLAAAGAIGFGLMKTLSRRSTAVIDNSQVDDVLEDSFPASDPPSWTPTVARATGSSSVSAHINSGDDTMRYSEYPASEGSTGSGVMWFALGLLGGAAVALLTSPGSGRENREALRRRAREVADTVSQEGNAFMNDPRQRMNDMMARGREGMQSFGSRMNDAVTHGKDAYRQAKDRFNHAANEAADTVRNAAEDVGSNV